LNNGKEAFKVQHSVLLVDDDKNLLASLQRSLHKERYDLICAESATEALELLRQRSVDLIVSDQQMPGISGTEFLSRVHREFPTIIRFMLTGKATLEVAVNAINQGAISRFFIKPCNVVDLAISIRQALQQRTLLLQANLLLRKVKHQERLIEKVERANPGISQVHRENDGSILLDDVPQDIDAFIDEVRDALQDKKEKASGHR